MAFDSGFFSASLAEIRAACLSSRVEKVYQPQADEIDINFRSKDGSARLCLRCGASDARIALTSAQKDNPAVPPNFCMLLRKHLSGAVLLGCEQQEFERVAVFSFGCRDELGYDCERRLIAEITGRNSNLIFTDENGKILGAMRVVDFSTSRLRQVLPGMKYELPPVQEGKIDPRHETPEHFCELLSCAEEEIPAWKFILNSYLGVCPAVAREAAYIAAGDSQVLCSFCDPEKLAKAFLGIIADMQNGKILPTLAYDGERAVDYSYVPLNQYGTANLRFFDKISELMDFFYGEKDRAALVQSRASDLTHTVNNALARLRRKLEIQSKELADCANADSFRADADLIVANMHLLKRGDREAVLTDYSQQNEDGSFVQRKVKLDAVLTPSAYAQKLYKKYAKCRTAKIELDRQMGIARDELEYLLTVKDALSRAETSADLSGIRQELEKEGYIRERRNAPPAKSVKNAPVTYTTTNGFTVLCGRNNLQNEEITFRLSEKGDMWFHAKGVPGSHVLLKAEGRELPDADMTEAAEIAAFNSDAGRGHQVPVDYTDVRNVKKPGGAKPGFVIYKTNLTAYVTPDGEKLEKLKNARKKF